MGRKTASGPHLAATAAAVIALIRLDIALLQSYVLVRTDSAARCDPGTIARVTGRTKFLIARFSFKQTSTEPQVGFVNGGPPRLQTGNAV